MKTVVAFYFTLPGPKMFWQFMEVGYDFSIDHNGRVGNKPIRWDYYQDPERRNLRQLAAVAEEPRDAVVLLPSQDLAV